MNLFAYNFKGGNYCWSFIGNWRNTM